MACARLCWLTSPVAAGWAAWPSRCQAAGYGKSYCHCGQLLAAAAEMSQVNVIQATCNWAALHLSPLRHLSPAAAATSVEAQHRPNRECRVAVHTCCHWQHSHNIAQHIISRIGDNCDQRKLPVVLWKKICIQQGATQLIPFWGGFKPQKQQSDRQHASNIHQMGSSVSSQCL